MTPARARAVPRETVLRRPAWRWAAGGSAILTLWVAAGAPAWGRQASAFPTLDIRAPYEPAPFDARGRTHVAYELHVTNISPRATALEAVEVRGAAAGPALFRLDGDRLRDSVRRLGVSAADARSLTVEGGQTTVVFIWLTMPDASRSRTLTHSFTVRAGPPQDAADPAMVLAGPPVRLSPSSPPVIAAPLAGDHWLAANGPDNGTDHRRTLLALSGQARIAQRFATDWVRLYEDGRTVRGDPAANANYRAYGANVLAVADGRVVHVVDGLPDNVPHPTERRVPITPLTLGGNYVLLDIGRGAFAVFGHLQPGSVTIRAGDRVRRGQVLGRVGNSGNSSEPHLHFHIVDRASALDGEGIPYVLDVHELEAPGGVITSSLVPAGHSLAIGAHGLTAWRRQARSRREHDLPLQNDIVAFR
jgi:murein DD-endopeptidase MepM/ murein hydrolase activator NlpD